MVFSNNLLLGAVSAAASDYLIEQSLLFDGSSYLTRTPSVAGNRKTWTFSAWVKRGSITSASLRIFDAYTDGNNYTWIQFTNTNDYIEVAEWSGSYTWRYDTAAKFRDPNAWYHIVVAFDSTQATASNRMRLWVNGTEITSFSTSTDPSLNHDTDVSAAVVHSIGRWGGASSYFDGLMAFPILVDGAALDATSFGELDDDGYWNPIEFAGADTVAYIPFGEGSIITDYSAETAKSFDGVFTSQAAGSGNVSRSASTTSCYMGKNFSASPRTVSGVICFGSNDQGFVHTDASASNVTLTLYGKNGGAPSNATDGTLLGSSTFARTSNESAGRYFASSDAVTEYDYIWIRTSHDGSADICYMTEITFETSTGNGYGTNGFVLDFADSSHFGNDVSGAGVTPDLTVATSWSGTNLAQYGFSAGNITKNTLSQNAIRTVGVWGGDFSITLDLLDGDGTFGTNEQFFGFASASDTFDDTKTASTITGTNYYIQPATDSATLMTYYRNGAALSTFAVVPGDTIKWERSGTTVTLYVNTVSRFSETTSLTGLVYGFIQLYKTNESADNVTTTGTFSNSFIDNGFVSTDQLADTPTDDVDLGIGNFFNFDPNATNAAVTLAEGNTKATFTGGTDYRANITGVTLPTSGKWYFEVEVTTLVSEVQIGVNLVANTATSGGNIGDSTGEIAYRSDGRKRESGSTTTFGATLPNGSLVGVAWDGDANKIWFAKTNSWQASGNPSAGTNPANSGTISTASYFAVKSYNSSVVNLNTGAKVFTYTPPTDFVALATQNLPAPTIADGSDYFNTVLWTGDATSPRKITTGFTPELIWIKNRTDVAGHQLFDIQRDSGTEPYLLASNSTAAETVTGRYLASLASSAFDTDGFNISSDGNVSAKNYVAWCWKAGGTASSNTDGTITSSVSANTTSGFSIVSYTGTGSAGATIGHGLGAVPKFIIVKNRTSGAADWAVYHASNTSAPETEYLALNTTGATIDQVTMWNDTAPTSSVFTTGASLYTGSNSNDYIAYCFAEVEGFSKFGSYVGNGSANGPFVYTGFKPAFILVKCSSAVSSWQILDASRDTYNPAAAKLYPDLTDAEASATQMDFVSNGFKIRIGGGSHPNVSAATYIYAAFAEHPFQGDEGYTQARAR
jgi:hypothetical protein